MQETFTRVLMATAMSFAHLIRARMKRTVYTIGHSTRSLDELAAILREHAVARVVDVRTIPRSAANPQYDAETLPEALAERGLEYTLMLGLGGRRPKSKVIADDVNAGWTSSPAASASCTSSAKRSRSPRRSRLSRTSGRIIASDIPPTTMDDRR
jgi:hypothetical protein